jgi:hypothetical protein
MKAKHTPTPLGRSLSILAFLLLGSSANAAITGTVFRDFNGNGTQQTSNPTEPGVAGVVVTAFDSAGVSQGTATSAANGSYSITATGAAPYRVEFTLSATGICATSGIDFSSGGGSSNGTSVQFVASGTAANVNFAVHNPSDYNQGTSGVSAFIPCYVSGDPLPSGSASGAEAWFFRDHYTNSGTTVKPPQMIGGGIIGPTWGVAYSKQAGKVFTSALLKRHVGLGTLGSGGIYLLTPTATSFTVNSFYDMDANGHRTRAAASAPAYGDGTSFSIAANNATVTYLGATDPLTGKPSGLGVIGTNTQRGLVTNPVIPSYDPAAFDQVGKVGLGDIDISDDGKYLFVMNLYSRMVFRLELDSATNPTAVTNVTSFSFPTIACVNGEFRPWGLKFFKNKVYAGVVCTGENGGTAADLNASVYVLNNPTGSASFDTTALINFPLNYDKVGDYRPWTNNSSSVTSTTYPTAILSDIEFTQEGNMVMGIMDRSGHQWGESNRKFLKTSTTSITLSTSGDVLLAVLNCGTGTYTLENNGSITSANSSVLTGSTNPDNTNQGPGGKEFFDDDSNVGDPHKETALGSLAILKGQSELFLAAYAQTNNSGDAGTFKVSTTNGSLLTSSVYQLYNRGNPDGVFAKANGLGDLEITRPAAPIEIGNRVWADTDGDGVQDAGEAGLSGVTVELRSGSTVLATATTDTNGNYIFSSAAGTSTPAFIYGITALKPSANYVVRVPTTVSGLSLTQVNQGGKDSVDSDAPATGDVPVLAADIPVAGANNHTFDIGYSSVVTCTITDLAFTGGTATCNDNGTPAVTTDDYFTSDVTVTFANAPTTGNLVLSGAALHSANTVTTVAVGSLGSTTSHTFTGVKLKANSTANPLVATFSADTACTFTKNTTAVPPCSNPTCPTITVTPSPLSSGTVGTAYAASPTASGGAAPYTWTATSLPTGLSINASTGAVTGTPTAIGNATITATDANSCTGTTTLTVIGCPVYQAQTASTTIDCGIPVSKQLSASGGTGPYTWSVTTGVLPSGLTLSTTGLLSGTTTATGPVAVTITTRDSASCPGVVNLTINITPCACPVITVTPAQLPQGSVGTAYNQTPSVSGAPSGSTYTWSATGLPAGLTINAASGAITGTPTAIGTATITATYAGPSGLVCTGTATLPVVNNCCPQLIFSAP